MELIVTSIDTTYLEIEELAKMVKEAIMDKPFESLWPTNACKEVSPYDDYVSSQGYLIGNCKSEVIYPKYPTDKDSQQAVVIKGRRPIDTTLEYSGTFNMNSDQRKLTQEFDRITIERSVSFIPNTFDRLSAQSTSAQGIERLKESILEKERKAEELRQANAAVFRIQPLPATWVNTVQTIGQRPLL